jgi:hypothetical protein
VRYVQLGTFFELYHLPDDFFLQLREAAERRSVIIHSVFTSHRELGGFFRREPGFEQVARWGYERLIEVAALLGAKSAGSNAGAVLRDQMDDKAAGLQRYMRHMKDLMAYAHERGLHWLTVEPMSCLAEPPTLADEIRAMAQEFDAHYRQAAGRCARVGYLTDISHGYADANGEVKESNVDLFLAALPWTVEVHLRNTDRIFNSTFGFTPTDRQRGIVDVRAFRDLLLARSSEPPVQELVGYFEISGPKLGRDYTDRTLESDLRQSLRYLKEAFEF